MQTINQEYVNDLNIMLLLQHDVVANVYCGGGLTAMEIARELKISINEVNDSLELLMKNDLITSFQHFNHTLYAVVDVDLSNYKPNYEIPADVWQMLPLLNYTSDTQVQ